MFRWTLNRKCSMSWTLYIHTELCGTKQCRNRQLNHLCLQRWRRATSTRTCSHTAGKGYNMDVILKYVESISQKGVVPTVAVWIFIHQMVCCDGKIASSNLWLLFIPALFFSSQKVKNSGAIDDPLGRVQRMCLMRQRSPGLDWWESSWRVCSFLLVGNETFLLARGLPKYPCGCLGQWWDWRLLNNTCMMCIGDRLMNHRWDSRSNKIKCSSHMQTKFEKW